jgi:hypothetical protein
MKHVVDIDIAVTHRGSRTHRVDVCHPNRMGCGERALLTLKPRPEPKNKTFILDMTDMSGNSAADAMKIGSMNPETTTR